MAVPIPVNVIIALRRAMFIYSAGISCVGMASSRPSRNAVIDVSYTDMPETNMDQFLVCMSYHNRTIPF